MQNAAVYAGYWHTLPTTSAPVNTLIFTDSASSCLRLRSLNDPTRERTKRGCRACALTDKPLVSHLILDLLDDSMRLLCHNWVTAVDVVQDVLAIRHTDTGPVKAKAQGHQQATQAIGCMEQIPPCKHQAGPEGLVVPSDVGVTVERYVNGCVAAHGVNSPEQNTQIGESGKH